MTINIYVYNWRHYIIECIFEVQEDIIHRVYSLRIITWLAATEVISLFILIIPVSIDTQLSINSLRILAHFF